MYAVDGISDESTDFQQVAVCGRQDRRDAMIAQRANRLLAWTLRGTHRLHKQVVRVGLLFIPLDRLADEHQACIAETQRP